MAYKLIDYERLKAFSEKLKTKYATKNDIPKKLSDLKEDTTHRLVTDTEKKKWNDKVSQSQIVEDGNSISSDTVWSTQFLDNQFTGFGQALNNFQEKLKNKIDKSQITDDFIGESTEKVVSQKGINEGFEGFSVMFNNYSQILNNKADTDDIPQKLSQLTNDKTFKTESEIQQMIEKASSLKKEVVTSLPTAGKDDVIYLVKDDKGKDNNNYLEYLWLNGKYELIGSTQVDLSGYVTKEEAQQSEIAFSNAFEGLTEQVTEMLSTKASVDDMVASRFVEEYELDQDYWDAMKNDVPFYNARNRDMLTLVRFKKGDEFHNRIANAGFESALFYKGTPLGFGFVARNLWSTFSDDVKNNTLPEDRTIIQAKMLAKYNEVIQSQLKEQQSQSLNKTDIQEFTQKELEEAFK